MGPEEARRNGFGMSRDAHIAFVAVYLTILLMVAGFGALRFALTVPYLQFHWPVAPAAGVVGDHGPLADPAWLGAHRATYPPIPQKLHQEGDVLVQLTVLPDGSVGDAKIVKSSGSPQLDASALVGVGYWRYRPAMRNGKPVAANVTVRVVFRLQNSGPFPAPKLWSMSGRENRRRCLMQSVLIAIQLLVSIGLIAVVLLQRSEGGALGMGGGGSGLGGLFSPRGAADTLTRTTAILAVLFFATSLALTLLALHGRTESFLATPPNAPAQTLNLLKNLQHPAQPKVPSVPAPY